MSFMCFPVAVQGPTTQHSAGSLELDLLAEMTSNVIEFARKLKAKSQAARPALTQADTLGQRLALAQNPDTPVALMEALSLDGASSIRNALVFNRALPGYLLQQLAHDQDRFIASQARARLAMVA